MFGCPRLKGIGAFSDPTALSPGFLDFQPLEANRSSPPTPLPVSPVLQRERERESLDLNAAVTPAAVPFSLGVSTTGSFSWLDACVSLASPPPPPSADLQRRQQPAAAAAAPLLQ